MKFAASILLIYFSALMAQPYVNIWSGLRNKPNTCHPAPTCCKEMAKHKGNPASNQANTCNRDFCNPFLPCGVSIAYRTSVLRFENKAFEVAKNLKPAINDAIISDYFSDCWRPPELA
jgi:hypothetical protein